MGAQLIIRPRNPRDTSNFQLVQLEAGLVLAVFTPIVFVFVF